MLSLIVLRCRLREKIEVNFVFIFDVSCSVSPEKLFLDLAINNTDNTAADMLAITTGLDVNMLYQVTS